jgi:D-alanyl-D-alanine carboxypeptidase
MQRDKWPGEEIATPIMSEEHQQARCGPRFRMPGTLSLYLFLFSFLLMIPGLAQAQSGAKIDWPPSKPFLVMDIDSGEVLMENQAFQRWHPASLTKLMTAYIVFKAIETHEIEPGSPVTITSTARKMPPSRMGYREGVRLRFDNAIRILIVKSANDVAVAIAESLSGSVDAFVARMNREAQNLGLRDTQFVNPNGLHDEAQYTSARDLAILARTILKSFPQYHALFATPTLRSGDHLLYSYNLLLERFDGADGMKTGFVCASGYNMVASATRAGRSILAVIFGAESQTERAVTAARLLLTGFDQATGRPIDTLVRPEAVSGPNNLRHHMCSEHARQNRYDPAPQFAELSSPYLNKRTIEKKPLTVSVGNITGPASKGWLSRKFGDIPLPSRRPENLVESASVLETPGPAGLRGSIPVPELRPKAKAGQL